MSAINPVPEGTEKAVSKNYDIEITAAPNAPSINYDKDLANNVEILGHEQIDPALNAKMHLINSVSQSSHVSIYIHRS